MHRALKTCHRVRWPHHHLCTFANANVCIRSSYALLNHDFLIRHDARWCTSTTNLRIASSHIIAHTSRARAMGAHARGRFVAVKTRLSNPSARGYVFLFKSSSSRERFPPRGFHRPSSSSSSSSHTRRRPRPRRPRRRAHTPRAKTRSQNASSYAPQHFFN